MNGIAWTQPFLQHTSTRQDTEGVLTEEETSEAFRTFLFQSQQMGAENSLLSTEEDMEGLLNQEEILPLNLHWWNSETEEGLSQAVEESLGNWQYAVEDLEQAEASFQGLEVSPASMVQALQDIQSLLHQLINVETPNTKKISGEILPLMEQWVQGRQHTDANSLKLLESTHLSEEEAEVFESLLSRYAKRQFFSGRNMYGDNAGVTKADIQQWLGHIIPEVKGRNPLHLQPAEGNVQPPVMMTVQQQHTIHMSEAVRVDRVGPELVNQLEMIVKDSKFLTRGTQHLELSILLKPQHLGNMTLRFQQVEGEMTVKILVSTHMAKEALESNIHQLKHLFSPHQIQVERDGNITDEDFFGEDTQEQDQEDELTDTEKEHHQEQEQQEPSGEDFETILRTLGEEGIL